MVGFALGFCVVGVMMLGLKVTVEEGTPEGAADVGRAVVGVAVGS
jgi:hypothetical protein